jgi:hypothetical protein
MNEPRNKQQDIAGLVFSLQTKPLLFSSERQFKKKVVSMVSNLLVFSFSPYPSPFSHFESPIVCDCLSLNTFHFACDNAEDNAIGKEIPFLLERECKLECIFVSFISCHCTLEFHIAKAPLST